MNAASFATAFADPEFHLYESKAPLIKTGQGGERTVIDGIDVWTHGDPPKRYQVLGSLTDERKNHSSFLGLVSNPAKRLNADIAQATKAAGGDAAILDTEQDIVSSYMDLSDQNGGGPIVPLRRHQSRFIVVKYLPDAPAQ